MSEPAAPLPTPIEPWEVLDLLTVLVRKSLAVYEEDEQGCGRYRLLEPMRQHARARRRTGPAAPTRAPTPGSAHPPRALAVAVAVRLTLLCMSRHRIERNLYASKR